MLALVFGYVALYAAKGAAVHRKTGMLFVLAMVTHVPQRRLDGGADQVADIGQRRCGPADVLFRDHGTHYGQAPPSSGCSWIDRAAVFVALTVSVLAFKAGFDLLTSGRPEAVPSFIFGVVGLLAASGDFRMMRAGGIRGPRRIARHLWRMCFAMWVAAASFFWGPPNRVPEAIRIPALQAVAVLVPVAVMSVLAVARPRQTVLARHRERERG